jgi:hypothetical protein
MCPPLCSLCDARCALGEQGVRTHLVPSVCAHDRACVSRYAFLRHAMSCSSERAATSQNIGLALLGSSKMTAAIGFLRELRSWCIPQWWEATVVEAHLPVGMNMPMRTLSWVHSSRCVNERKRRMLIAARRSDPLRNGEPCRCWTDLHNLSDQREQVYVMS